MKKMSGIIASLFLFTIAANAQKEKEPPPPLPPPKAVEKTIIEEIVKVDENGIPEEPSVITIRGKRADDFYKRNPSVAEISRKQNIITIKKKDGKIEKYDMSKKEEDKSFTEKYGVSPIPPPPPPKEVIKYKKTS